jgi:hypothetical protein
MTPDSAFFDRLSSFAQQAVASVKVKSALNPCLWLCAFVMPISLAGMYLSTGAIQVAFVAAFFTPLLVFAIGFIYFMIVNPDKLRSEEYELRKMALNLIEEKGGTIPVAVASVEAISNAEYMRPLLGGEEQ